MVYSLWYIEIENGYSDVEILDIHSVDYSIVTLVMPQGSPLALNSDVFRNREKTRSDAAPVSILLRENLSLLFVSLSN